MMHTDTAARRIARRPYTFGGLALVVTSIVFSLVSRDLLGETVRLRWTVGPYYHVGPELVSTHLVLVAFPVVVTGLYVVGLWLLDRWLRDRSTDHDPTVRTLLEATVLAVLGLFVAAQLLVLGLNLWLP